MFGKKKVAAKARILADEGYGMAKNSGSVALQHQKYIIEVHPPDEPSFRIEVKAWVSWTDRPQEGDEVNVLYKPGTHDAELDLEGDPRFDWELRASEQASKDAARRDELLNG
jgi:hypothetical protein